jgi:hypothetical protein
MVGRGDVPKDPKYIQRFDKNAVLNSLDWYGAHDYQDQKTHDEVRSLVRQLQPNPDKVRNLGEYLSVPLAPGLAFEIAK